jgi:hypothetical protein
MTKRLKQMRGAMQAWFHSWWKITKQHWKGIGIGGLIVLIMLIVLGYMFHWEWMGLSGYAPPNKEYQREKTLWDWLQLLIVPIILAIGGFWLNQIQKSREQKTTEQQEKLKRELAHDEQQEQLLQVYIDKISELLLKEHLRGSIPVDSKFPLNESVLQSEYDVRVVARARTLTVLSRLDGGRRKRSLLQFLYESGLLEKDEAIILLYGTDLREADLSRAYLSRAHLSGVDLSGAYLSETNLKDASLRFANLLGANLSRADLSGADLEGAINTTIEQLEQAKSLEGTTMPDGTKHS